MPLPPEVVANLAAKRLGLGQQRDTALRSLGDQYNENVANLNKFSQEGGQRINDQMGAQGLYSSGIRVDQQGKLQQNVAQRRGFLESGYGSGQAGIQNQYTQGMAGIQGEEYGLSNQFQQQELAKQQQDAQMQFQQQQADAQRNALAVQQWNAALAQNQQTAQQNAAAMQQAAAQQDAERAAAEAQWYAVASDPFREFYASLDRLGIPYTRTS